MTIYHCHKRSFILPGNTTHSYINVVPLNSVWNIKQSILNDKIKPSSLKNSKSMFQPMSPLYKYDPSNRWQLFFFRWSFIHSFTSGIIYILPALSFSNLSMFYSYERLLYLRVDKHQRSDDDCYKKLCRCGRGEWLSWSSSKANF